MRPGSIVRIYAPTVGYNKYHLCLRAAGPGQVAEFIFMSSEPGFDASLDVPCARVPCIPPSETGYTCISLNRIIRYSEHQLKLFQSLTLGEMDQTLAVNLHAFALIPANVEALPKSKAAWVRQELALLAQPPGVR